MTFQVRIQNLGKIRGDATVRISPLTVLAGPNNTGKTFFSKALYSAFDSINERDENHAIAAFAHRIFPVRENLAPLSLPRIPDGDMGVSLLCALDEMGNAIGAYDETGAVAGMSPESLAAFGEAADGVKREYKRLADTYGKLPDVDMQWLTAAVDRLVALGGMSLDELTAAGVEGRFSKNLLLNLQCGATLDTLRTCRHVNTWVEIEGAGVFSFGLSGDNAQFTPNPDIPVSSALAMLRKRAKVRFLGPPALWQVRTALGNARRIRSQRSSNGRELMDGVPRCFEDLEELLAQGELSGGVAFPKALQRLTEIIGGKIVRHDDSGQLFFHEGEETVPLSSTASGVVPLGILAMLIERKLVDKGTFLFIDEPESNLHPAWQVEMVRALFALARGGVNVVMATHSADMMERLRALAAKHPGSEEMIALNHFSHDGVNKGGDKSFRERMGDILEELTEEFSESFMENVL